MENWIPDIITILAVIGLWWKASFDLGKLNEKMATKDDVREIRQMLFSHISDGHKQLHQSPLPLTGMWGGRRPPFLLRSFHLSNLPSFRSLLHSNVLSTINTPRIGCDSPVPCQNNLDICPYFWYHSSRVIRCRGSSVGRAVD